MKILIMTLGTRGDVQPFLALGQNLQARGHNVSMFASRSFHDSIESAGLTPCCSTAQSSDVFDFERAETSLHDPRGWPALWRSFRTVMHRQMSEMWRVGMETDADIILYGPFAFLASRIARAKGVPAVPVFFQPAFAPTSAFPSFIVSARSLGRVGNRLSYRLSLGLGRAAIGLLTRSWRRAGLGNPGKRLNPFAGYGADGLRIHAFSPSLLPDYDDLGPGNHVTGAFLSPPPEDQPDETLTAFLAQGRPPVFVGFSSAPGIDPVALSHAAVAALKATRQRGIIATGSGGLARVEADEDILFITSAPHSWLFPRCIAIVHHGGAGTLHEALRAGRPSVVCPLSVDQPFWARALHRSGAGPAPLPQHEVTPETLTHALRLALNDWSRAKAGAIGRAIRAEDGCTRAAELIEAVVRQDRPR